MRCGVRRRRGAGRAGTVPGPHTIRAESPAQAMPAAYLSAASALALGLYLNTLQADFAYDDSRAIQKNPDLLPGTPLINLFYNDFWGTPLTHSGSHKSYRPLCVLTFRLNHALGGLVPWGYHLGNVLLHALVAALFTYTVYQLSRRTFTALVAGLLFAAHPIHTEAVAGVVGRADILACLFFLLAFLAYMRYCKCRDKRGPWRTSTNAETALQLEKASRWPPLLLVAIFTAAGMLSKEQGVTVLAVCATYDVFIQSRLRIVDLLLIYRSKYRAVQEGLFSLAAIGIGLVTFRVYFMGNKPPEFAPADNPASDSDSPLTRTLTYFYLPFLNFKILLYPSVLSFDWSMDAVPLLESITDLRNLGTLTFYSVLGYLGWYILTNLNHRLPEKVHNGNGYAPHISTSHQYTNKPSNSVRRRANSRRGSNSSTDSAEDFPGAAEARHHRTLNILLLCLALLIFPFIPATNLFFYVGFVIAERVLYIPSMGFCLLVAQGAYLLHRKYVDEDVKRKLLCMALGGLIAAYSARTVIRNMDWYSEENLYRSGISVNPAKAWGNLANILNSQGKTHDAENAYRNALNHRGNMADVHYNLGILLQEQKRYSEAVESYKMAIKCRPRLTMAHLNLGIVYNILGMKEEAMQIYKHCAEIDISGLKDPRLHESTKISALYNLGRLLADQEHYQDAIQVYLQAIQRRPSHYTPQSLYNMLGEAYSKLDRLEEAEHWYREALRAKPDHIPAHLTMGKLLHRRGSLVEAEQWYQKAKSIDPRDSSIYQHYGQFLADVNRHIEAADNYVKAAQLNPEDFELVFNTANALRQAAKNEDAETYYRKAAYLKPNVATAHMNLGAMLHFNGKLEEAEQSYLVALKLKPDDTVTQTNLKKLRNLLNKPGSR